jgi:hypothetical protein
MRCVSMLLFLLCACTGVGPLGVCTAGPSPFNDPSAVLLKPCVAGDSRGVGQAAVSPVRGAFAATVSIRGAACASGPRTWPGDCGIGASVGLAWSVATWVDDGDVDSISVVVDVERLLGTEGNFGAENVLDAVEITESCEFGRSDVETGAIVGV